MLWAQSGPWATPAARPGHVGSRHCCVRLAARGKQGRRGFRPAACARCGRDDRFVRARCLPAEPLRLPPAVLGKMGISTATPASQVPPGGNLSLKDKVPPARSTGAPPARAGRGVPACPCPDPHPRPPPSPAHLSLSETHPHPRTWVPGGDERGTLPRPQHPQPVGSSEGAPVGADALPRHGPSRRSSPVTAGHQVSASRNRSRDRPRGRKQGGGSQHTEAAGRTPGRCVARPSSQPHEHSLPAGQCRCPGMRPLSPGTLRKADACWRLEGIWRERFCPCGAHSSGTCVLGPGSPGRLMAQRGAEPGSSPKSLHLAVGHAGD